MIAEAGYYILGVRTLGKKPAIMVKGINGFIMSTRVTCSSRLATEVALFYLLIAVNNG